MKSKMPKELLVYICDYDSDDDKPIFAAVTDVKDIPEDVDGEQVANYTLNKLSTFKVHRELKQP